MLLVFGIWPVLPDFAVLAVLAMMAVLAILTALDVLAALAVLAVFVCIGEGLKNTEESVNTFHLGLPPQTVT